MRVELSWWALWCSLAMSASGAPVLPVYVEDNHAGAFYFLAEELELEEQFTLVLIDAHSDASAAPDSDLIRTGVRRVRSEADRSARLSEWRQTGRIQANDWIEPLMPRPIARVLWVAGQELDAEKRKVLEDEAHRHLDGRLEGEGREAGSLRGRFAVTDLVTLPTLLEEDDSLVVSLDLDFFTGMAEAEFEDAWERVWGSILSLPRLQALTIAVSRPWLRDDAEAERLLGRAIEAVCAVENAELRFEPFASCGPDRTRRAKEFYAEGRQPPRLALDDCGVDLQKILARAGERLEVRLENERWRVLVDGWRSAEAGWWLEVDDAQRATDGIVRVECGVQRALRLRGNEGSGARSVRWFQRVPAGTCYNVMPEVLAGKRFSKDAGAWMKSVDQLVAETSEPALSWERWRALTDAQGGMGVVRLWAEIDGEARTPVLEVRLTEGDGFHAGLAEQFGLPYVFGAGVLRRGDREGPETGWGNDCANFLVAAWRRNGRALRWCDPSRLRGYLEEVGVVELDGAGLRLDAGAVERGVVVHFGTHVAAVWKDVPPLGVLTEADEVAHHLGGIPEVLTIGELLRTRDCSEAEVLQLRREEAAITLVFGGDVNVAGMDDGGRAAIDLWREEFASADVAIVNLECVLGEAGRAQEKRFVFRAPAETARALAAAGVDAVSLGNNHAGDFGVEGFREMRRHLTAAGLSWSGAGETLESAVRPVRFERNGVGVSVFAMSLVQPERFVAQVSLPGVVHLPEHEAEVLDAIGQERARGVAVVAFVHWGEEYTDRITMAQRAWARSLIEAGAHAVVGTHPHHPQSADVWKGRPIVYSLGNLIFPGVGPNPGFRQAGLLRLEVGERARIVNWQVTRQPLPPLRLREQ